MINLFKEQEVIDLASVLLEIIILVLCLKIEQFVEFHLFTFIIRPLVTRLRCSNLLLFRLTNINSN